MMFNNNVWWHISYGFICGSVIIIWNNRITDLCFQEPRQPTWNRQHTQSDSHHHCHIPTSTSHSQTHQQSPWHSWSCLTEIDLFCYGPVNPWRRAAIITARSHMRIKPQCQSHQHISARRDHSDHMTVRICSAQLQSETGTISIIPHIIMLCDSSLFFGKCVRRWLCNPWKMSEMFLMSQDD